MVEQGLESACQLGEAPGLFHLDCEANPLARLHNNENVSRRPVMSSVIFMTCELGCFARNLRTVQCVTARELKIKAIFLTKIIKRGREGESETIWGTEGNPA